MASPTMELLKGGKGATGKGPDKAKEAKVSKEPGAEVAEEEEAVVITEVPDFSAMSTKAIKTFYEEVCPFELEGFEKEKLAGKRAALYSVYNEVVHEIEGLEEEFDPDADYGTVEEEPEEEPEPEVEEPKKAKGKGKGKGKEVATTSKAKDGEVLPPDIISKTAHELENLPSEAKAHTMLADLIEEEGFNRFKLGGILSVIQVNGWFGDQENFKAWVDNNLKGMSYRTAASITKMYGDVIDSEVSWDDVESVGFTSLMKIAPILTKKNVKGWVKKATKMSTLQLEEEIKAYRQAQLSKESGEGTVEAAPAKTVKAKTFKVHEDQGEIIDQALEDAKAESGTDVDTVALEFICTEYLGGGKSKTKKAKPLTLSQQFEAILEANEGDIQEAVTEVMGAFDKVFPDVDVSLEFGEEGE